MRIAYLALIAASAWAADVDDRTVESRSFPNAHLVILDNVNGSIEVTGYNGNDIQMDVSKHIQAESAERLDAARKEVKLDAQQSGDTLKLYVDGPFRCNCCDHNCNGSRHQGYEVTYDFKLRVPVAARVDLYTVNHGQVVVRGVTGEFDIRNVNGGIEMTDIGGSGKAHTVNGAVKVAFTRNPSLASSFETVNGTVDLSFRPGLAADVRMQTMHGGMYTDFDVTTLPVEATAATKQDGKYVFRRGGSTGVKVGRGGVDLRIKTINGDIFVRERK